MISFLYRSIIVLAAASLVACNADTASPPVTVNPMPIGAAGGTVSGPGGAQIVVPAGALSSDVDLAIAQSSAGAPAFPPAGASSAGTVFAATPHGTTFAVPVTVRIPFDPSLLPAGATPQLFKAEPGGSFTQIAATV